MKNIRVWLVIGTLAYVLNFFLFSDASAFFEPWKYIQWILTGMN